MGVKVWKISSKINNQKQNKKKRLISQIANAKRQKLQLSAFWVQKRKKLCVKEEKKKEEKKERERERKVKKRFRVNKFKVNFESKYNFRSNRND